MKIQVALYFALLGLATTLNAQSFEWVKGIGSANQDVAYSMALDASKNIYLCGFFGGTVDFDPGLGVTSFTSQGLEDIFIAKYDSSGQLLWATSMGDFSSDRAWGITLDDSNNIYITGGFDGTMDVDPGPGVVNLASGPSILDPFVLKLSNSGSYIWAKSFIGGGGEGRSIVVDGAGGVYSTGTFGGTVDFNPAFPGNFNLTSNAQGDIYISKLDVSGNFVWAAAFGGTGIDVANAIKLDASSNVYTTGFFEDTVDFDPSANVLNLASSGQRDVFVSKLNSSGTFQWAISYGGTGNEQGHGIAVDGSDNLYIVGSFGQTVDFDPSSTGTFNISSGNSFVQKLDAFGNFIWANAFGSNAFYSVALDTNNNIYTSGISDVYKLDSLGNLIWTRSLAVGAYLRNIAVDNLGAVYTSGYFLFLEDFNPGTGINNLTNAGNWDVLIHKLGVCVDSTSTDTQIACGSYTWIDGNTYTSNNNTATYTTVAGTENGCDLIQTLNLTITETLNNATTLSGTTLTATQAGATYQWLDCNNGNAIISGATSQSITPSATGNYAVEITLNSCLDTSSCTLVTISGDTTSIKEFGINNISLFPNPTSTVTSISGLSNGQTLKIIDTTGKVVYQTHVNSSTLDLDVNSIENGVYIIQIEQKGAVAQKKLVVSK